MADESMSSGPLVLRGINWRETFPFTHLFRAFRIAVHPSKLMLGLVTLLSLYVGGRLLDGLWPARFLAVPGEVKLYEINANNGGTSEEFVHQRALTRDRIEDA